MLTVEQEAQIKRLVRLGDSLELATKTVKEMKVFDDSLYRLAYHS
jgi:hypothetical protein